MTTELAPIALFVFRRPDHTRAVLDSLAANAESRRSPLYIFCDGARRDSEAALIQEVRQIVRAEQRFGRTIVIEREANMGLANSIIGGVTDIVERHGRVIVVEDDLVFSRYFLRYMNDALAMYEHEPRVGQIGACNFFACGPRYPQSFFATIPDCWGWATWRDRWAQFEPDATKLLHELKRSRKMHDFNVFNSHPMDRMLRDQIEGKVDSWAIRWQAVCVLREWLTLYPNPSMSNHVESLQSTHMEGSILPPLVTDEYALRPANVALLPEIKQALRRGYAGISRPDGTLDFSKRRALLKLVLRNVTAGRAAM